MLFDKGDIEALTEKTLYAAGDSDVRLEIGRRARKAAAFGTRAGRDGAQIRSDSLQSGFWTAMS